MGCFKLNGTSCVLKVYNGIIDRIEQGSDLYCFLRKKRTVMK